MPNEWIFRHLPLPNQFRLWRYFLEVPSWQVLKLAPFSMDGRFRFWNVHRIFDGVCVEPCSGTQTHTPSRLSSPNGFVSVAYLVPSCS